MARPELVPPIARYFTQLKPMEPVARRQPFGSPAHLFQIKWDGVRILAFKEGERVFLQNRRGYIRTAQYPELQALREMLGKREVILDGEAVVMEAGRPSFPRVIQRDFCRRESTIKAYTRSLPVTYCVFDLLYLDGEDWTAQPYRQRQSLLGELLRSQGPVYVNPNFDHGLDLYRQVERMGLEGIVAKEAVSPYLPGVKSRYWLKIKNRRRLLCVVGGLLRSKGTVGALLLGVYRDGALYYVGRAGSGLSRQDVLALERHAAGRALARPVFINPPRGGDYLWLEPLLTVLVEFAEWTEDMSLRAPVVIGFSSRPPGDAVI